MLAHLAFVWHYVALFSLIVAQAKAVGGLLMKLGKRLHEISTLNYFNPRFFLPWIFLPSFRSWRKLKPLQKIVLQGRNVKNLKIPNKFLSMNFKSSKSGPRAINEAGKKVAWNFNPKLFQPWFFFLPSFSTQKS